MVQKISLWAGAITLLLATSCNKTSADTANLVAAFALGQTATATNAPGKVGAAQVQFGFGQTASTAASAYRASGAGFTAQSTPSSTMNAPNASQVVVTIVDSVGNTIYNTQSIGLIIMGSGYLSLPLALSPGTYTLTQFLVADNNGNALYATPVEGSALAHLVADPLPISFSVNKDHVTNVTPEVLAVSGNPGDFGYATFGFKIVDTISFLIAAISQDATGQAGLTSADVQIQAWTPGQYPGVRQQVTIPAATTLLAVPAGYDRYAFILIHPGDDGLPMLCSIRPSNAANPLTSTDLKAFSATPLTFQLTGDDCGF